MLLGLGAQEAKLKGWLETGANKATPAMVVHGTIDEVVKPECGLKVAELLEKAGTPVQTMTYQMGHSTHPAQMKQTAEFVKACGSASARIAVDARCAALDSSLGVAPQPSAHMSKPSSVCRARAPPSP